MSRQLEIGGVALWMKVSARYLEVHVLETHEMIDRVLLRRRAEADAYIRRLRKLIEAEEPARIPCSFNLLRNPEILGGFVVALVGARDDHYVAGGSAVIVGVGLALTAGHVVRGILKEFGIPDNRIGNIDLSVLGIRMAAVLPNRGESMIALSVRRVHGVDGDIALLEVAAPDGVPFEWNAVHLGLMPPAVGEKVTVLGFPRLRVWDKGEMLGVEFAFGVSIGQVEVVYPSERDTSFLSFPCFQLTARCDHGMSGGPVIDSRGHVVGLVCTSITQPHDSEHTSFAATLWPLLTFSVDVPIADPPEHPYSPRILFERGVLRGADWEQCDVVRDGAGFRAAVPRMLAVGLPKLD